MTFDLNIIIYLLGVAALWGATQAEIKALRRDIERLDNKVMKHNNLVERMAVVEQRTTSAHYRIDEILKEEELI